MRRVWLLVKFFVVLVKVLVVGVLLCCVVARDKVFSGLSHNYEDENSEDPQTPENTKIHHSQKPESK